VLEGSVRRAGARVGVNAQLIEAETGAYIWADRYDRPLADLFAMQNEIVEAVTRAIEPAVQVQDAERRRALREPPQDLNAWEAYQRAMAHYHVRDFQLRMTRALIGVIHYLRGDYAAAVGIGESLVRTHPEYPHGYWLFVAALGRLGDRERGRAILAQWAIAAPGQSRLCTSQGMPWFHAEQADQILDGMRAGGWTG
jgi:hypothetical protein